VDEKSLIDELWPALEPSPDFPHRVLAAMDGVTLRATTRRRGRRLALVGVAAAAVVLPLATWLATRPASPAGPTFGDLETAERRTITIANRAVAVAEPGADLSWTSAAGRLRVDQRHGAVFYRVERGGPFVVSTEAAEIRVTGTCFQVEIDGGVSVHVLEGSVVVSNARGHLALTAGDRARVETGLPPALVSLPDERDVTARHRERVQQLESALREARRGAREPPLEARLPEHKYQDFSPEELKELAGRCEFRYARPQHLVGFGPPDVGGRFDLDDRERAAVLQIMEDQRTRFVEDLRGIYLEIVGDRAVANALSPLALIDEISAKSRPGEDVEARDRLFDEWAGRAAPPASITTRPAVERFWRLVFAAPEVFIKRLSEVVGPERARAIAKAGVHDRVFIAGPCGRFKKP
jgi:hypothetical protein